MAIEADKNELKRRMDGAIDALKREFEDCVSPSLRTWIRWW
jgi:hypothetical protein